MTARAPSPRISRRKLYALLAGSLSIPALTSVLMAASGTWTASSSTDPLLWSDSANWSASPSPAPGSTSSTSNSEVATFNAGSNIITIDSGRNLRTITFDTNAGAFTLGSAGANGGNPLTLTTNGVIQIASAFTGIGVKETINAPLVLMGTTTFTNNSLDSSNTLTIAGGITGGTASSLTLTLNGANTGDNIVSGVISNGTASAMNITKSSGTWTLSGANTFTGTTTSTGGTLKITSDASLGAAPVSATPGSIVLSSSSVTSNILSTGSSFSLNSNRGITLGSTTNNTGGTISVTDGATVTYGGIIASPGTANIFNKSGNGTLALSGANTYTGTAKVSQGTLRLDFSAAGAPTDNIIKSGNALSLGSDVATSDNLEIVGHGTNTQTFGNVAYTPGASHIKLVPGTGTLTLALGSIGPHSTGSTLDITLPANAVVTTTSANTTPSGGPSLVGNAVTINGTDFATINGSGQIVAVSAGSYTNNTANSLGSGNALTDMTTAATTLSAGVTLSGLRFNTAQNTTLTLDPGVNLIIGGGSIAGQILVTSNMGANNALITGGGYLGGISARDFVVSQHNTAGDLQIDLTINDFNNNISGFTKSGAGKVILTATNAYQGLNFINEGTVVVAGDVKAASTQTLSITSGTNTLTVSDASNLFVGERVSGTGIVNGTYIRAISGNTVTLSSNANATGSGDITFLGGGGLGLNTSGVTGGASVSVANGATLQIGNGGTTGTLVAGQAITNHGAVVLNRSDDFTFSNVVTNNHSVTTLGAGTFTKLGTNTATIDVLNSYQGATTISGGTLSVGSGPAATTVSSGGTTTNSGNVITDINTTGLVVGQAITGTGIASGAVITAIGTNTVTMSANGTANASNTYTFLGGASALANGGVNSAIGKSSSDAANLVLDSGTLKYTGASAASTDRLFTVTQNGGGLNASGASNAAVNFTNTGAVAFTGSGARTLALSGSSTGDNTLSAVIGNGSGGATSLTKSGAGKWVLNGANTYTGNTNITAGTLALGANGSIASSAVINLGTSGSQGTLDLSAKTGGFTLGSGQTLAGFGNVNIGSSTLTIGSGASLAPGNSPGVVNITGNLALDAGSFTTLEIAGTATDGNTATGFDRVIVSGSLTFGGNLDITAFNGYALGTTNASYDLFDFSGLPAGTFNSVTVVGSALTASSGVWTTTTGGFTYTFTESSGVLTIAGSAVPEPSTAAALAGLVVLCSATIRRRRTKRN
jgi:fibronectin-binding autotransporter adhesin